MEPTHDNWIGLLAVGNSLFAATQNLIAKLEPVLHLLLTGCQIAVAIATVLYVIKKTRALRLPRIKRKRK